MNCIDILVIVGALFIGWYMTEGHKTQWVRLIDVFIYGPFLIMVAMTIEVVWVRIILLVMGATTISYNLRNYLSECATINNL